MISKIFAVITVFIVTLLKIVIEIVLVPFRVLSSLYRTYKPNKSQPKEYDDEFDDWEEY